jgi:hypothetical protein
MRWSSRATLPDAGIGQVDDVPSYTSFAAGFFHNNTRIPIQATSRRFKIYVVSPGQSTVLVLRVGRRRTRQWIRA